MKLEPTLIKPIAQPTSTNKKETPSLKILPKLNATPVEVGTQEGIDENQTITNAPVNEFTLAQLSAKWLEYMHLRAADGKLNDSDKIIFNKELDIVNGHIVKIKISSTLEQDILSRFEIDLLGFLRRELSNSTIKIVTELVQTVETTRKLYTNKDKLEYMLTQNSKLKKLQELLGLDTDF